MRKPIAEFEIVDHGIDNSQYFQGCGLAFTEFEDVATGCGDDLASAIDDALESLAQNDWETDGMEARLLEDAGLKAWPKKPKVTSKMNDETYYYASIRVK